MHITTRQAQVDLVLNEILRIARDKGFQVVLGKFALGTTESSQALLKIFDITKSVCADVPS